MAVSAQGKVLVHYNHADACSRARWTAKECYNYMYQRDWKAVTGFYSGLVDGRFSLSTLFGLEPVSQEVLSTVDADAGSFEERRFGNDQRKGGRWARVTFKIVLSYHGGSFDGWQKQPGLNTVQGFVEKSLGTFVDERKAKQLVDKSLPVEGCAVVAGRTDKGVTALQQVCSFYTWREDVKIVDIEQSINSIAPGKIRVKCVSQESRTFHPNFSAKWRRYLYIFPINEDEHLEDSEEIGDKANSSQEDTHECRRMWNPYVNDSGTSILNDDEEWEEDEEEVSENKPRRFSINRVNELLLQLEGKTLSYRMFARDTKASRSMGAPTECFMFHARAAEASLPLMLNHANDHSIMHSHRGEKDLKVMCVELVANRFLRKMVRVLVATSIREAAAGAGQDALLQLMDAKVQLLRRHPQTASASLMSATQTSILTFASSHKTIIFFTLSIVGSKNIMSL